MIDFDTDILNEPEPAAPLTVAKEDQRPPPGRAAPAELARAAALEAAKAAMTMGEVPTDDLATDEVATDEVAPQARSPDAEPGRAADMVDKQAAARRRALVRALARLHREPRSSDLLALLTAYRSAAEAEVQEAAEAVTTLYLRAETEARRRLRPVLSEATCRARHSPLAKALVGRLGAIALPRQAPRPPPSAPAP